MTSGPPRYRGVMLKLSGEALMGDKPVGSLCIDFPFLKETARQLCRVRESGTRVGVVVGGGNIWRGAEAAAQGMDRAAADYAGMLATVINALALQDALEKLGAPVRTESALTIERVAEPYLRERALRFWAQGVILLFAAGTGNAFMTTDTAAALRAIELGADVLLMAKNRVDGVYEADPWANPEARRFDRLTYLEALNRGLEVMDTTALSLCMQHGLPIVVFDLRSSGSIERAALGEHIGTLVTA